MIEQPTKWDTKFMNLAREMATWSKDRSRQTACIIVGPGKEIRSTGYNGFPRGVYDSAEDVPRPNVAGLDNHLAKILLDRWEEKKQEVESRHNRPRKYLLCEHAERNSLYAAARMGTSVMGCTAYIPWYPCADCARGLIQSGIAELVCYEPDWHDPVWAKDFADVPIMLEEAGVKVRMLPNLCPQKPKGDTSNAQVRQTQV